MGKKFYKYGTAAFICIIYVGKSKDLRSRVSQYFRKSTGLPPKKLEMVRNIHEISHITVDTELDAFLTECRYIKEYRPRYNKQMKNDRKYVYIKLNLKRRPFTGTSLKG